MNILKGMRILITRPAHQADNLCRLITERGGTPVPFPTLAIAALEDYREARDILANLNRFQWLVFISANAVNFALKANGGKIDPIKSVRIAAIGRATRQALANAGIAADLAPENGSDSEALLAMPQLQPLTDQRYLIVRGKGGREQLADSLRANGARVEYLEVYQRRIPDIDKTPVLSLLAGKRLDIITTTSGEALQNLLTMVGKDYQQHLFAVPLVVVSGRIGAIAAQMGFTQVKVADNPSDAAILDTVTTIINGE